MTTVQVHHSGSRGHCFTKTSEMHSVAFSLFSFSVTCLVFPPFFSCHIKGIVHFDINFWCVLSDLKDIQDVGVFVSAVVSILIYF